MARLLRTVGVMMAVSAALVPACAHPAPANLIDNPGFERVAEGRAAGWAPFDKGYEVAADVRRTGEHAMRCVNSSADDVRGATWTLTLNQSAPAPIVVTGWSMAENVGGSANSDYAIYLDLVYVDGTPLWGQTAPFAVGTHDWQRKQVLVVPAKPVRTVSIHALFRHHAGTAWFDDFTASQLDGRGIFDSQAIVPPTLANGAKSGWFARDVAAATGLSRFSGNGAMACDALHLGLDVRPTDRSGSVLRARLADTTGKVRCITLYYVERVPATRMVWWSDLRRKEPMPASGERANVTRMSVGATGAISLYPFGCVTAKGFGRALGVDPELGPRVCRIGYHAGASLLYIAFDLALTADNLANNDGQGHGTAEVGVARYDVDPIWGFRDAAARYYRLFPVAFERRAKAEGLWIPFTSPATVDRVVDFGIAYHEGDNSIPDDNRLGILSFRYTEPMTWWMVMPSEMPRTYEAAVGLMKSTAAGTNAELKKWAQCVLTSCTEDETGRYNVEFQNAPWANGAVWTLNPNPRLPHPPDEYTKGALSYTKEQADRMYGPQAKGVQDGEYLDSIEGWSDTLDYRPESLKYSTLPLTFTPDTLRPVVPTWFSVYELARFMSDDLHARNKLLMANSTPWRIHAFAPVLDVMGTETNWLPGGQWRPDDDAIFNLRRTLCYHKPYLLLQNTDFDKFGVAQVEKYFQRSMFYGVFPSMFSVDAANHPYWDEPRWYNRDRELFKKYVPVIKNLSAAGWEPLTYATSSVPEVHVERFGTDYLTVFNDSPLRTTATVAIDSRKFGQATTLTVVDELTGKPLSASVRQSRTSVEVTLDPEQCVVIRLYGGKRLKPGAARRVGVDKVPPSG